MASVRSNAVEPLDFDGCYELVFQYEAGADDLHGLPSQAFVAIRRGIVVGLDGFGGIISGKARRLDAETVEFDVTFDPRTALDHVTVPDPFGVRSREPQRHMLQGKQFNVGQHLSFGAELRAGDIVIRGTMRRVRSYDGAHL